MRSRAHNQRAMPGRYMVIIVRVVYWVGVMASSSEEVLEAAVAGIPEIAQRIAFIPAANRAAAFDAVERSYLRTAENSRRHRRPCPEVDFGGHVSIV